MKYAKSNAAVAEATARLFLSNLPRLLQPPARQCIYALCPDRLRRAIGAPDPPRLLPAALALALSAAAAFVRHCMPPRRRRLRRTPAAPAAAGALLCPAFHSYERTYACGYRTARLGPAASEGDGGLGVLHG